MLDLPGSFDPARQQIVELQLREIGLDADLAVVIAARDLADDLDRDCAADGRTEIKPEPGATGVVEGGLQLDVGIALGRLAIIE